MALCRRTRDCWKLSSKKTIIFLQYDSLKSITIHSVSIHVCIYPWAPCWLFVILLTTLIHLQESNILKHILMDCEGFNFLLDWIIQAVMTYLLVLSKINLLYVFFCFVYFVICIFWDLFNMFLAINIAVVTWH